MTVANPENLIPNEARTPSERRENARKAGIASGEARRKRKSMKETIDLVLQMSLTSEEAMELTNIEDIQSFAEANGKNITVQDAMVLKQMQLALAGSQRSFELMRDTAGERPLERDRHNEQALEKLDEVLKEIGGVI